MPTVPGQPVDYLRLIEQDKRVADLDAAGEQVRALDGNPYLTLVQDEKKQREALARAAVMPHLDTKPEEYAGRLALAKETGLPVGVVATDPQTVARDARLNRIAGTVAKSPLLQAWALQDDNAILAMDDFENLSTLETAMRAVWDTVNAPVRELDVSIGQGVQGVGRTYRTFERAVDKGLRAIPGVGDAIADAQTVQVPWWAHPASWVEQAGKGIEWTGGPPLPEHRRNFATDTTGAFGQLVGQALVSRINPIAGTALMAGQGAEQAGRRAEAAGATQEQTDQAVVLGALITGASERMGLDILLERAPPKIKNRAVQWLVDKALAGGIEGTEEAVEQLANNYVAQMVYDPDAPIFEGVADNASLGAAVGVIARSLLGIRGVGLAARQTKSEQATLDALVKVAGASNLAKLAPDRFEGLVQQLAQNGAEHVYVPAETVKTLYQSSEPAQIAQELGIPVQDYSEAALTGGDVAIPIGAYLTRVAPQHGEALREVARFTPGSMTPQEAAELDERANEAAERFMASVATETASDQRVYEDVYGMLHETRRFQRSDIEKYAQIVQAGFRTLAARTGGDAFDLYARYRLRIKSELPVALQRTDIDTVIDPLIERLRAGDVPSEKAGRGPSLAEFLAEGGGIADEAMSGELRRLDESDRATRAGKPRLVRPDGARSLDYAREAAVEAGYLPDGADINDLLDALDNEFTGKDNRPVTDQATVDLRDSLTSLDDELRRREIDVTTATNADIKRALFGEDGREVPDELVRVFSQSAAPRDLEVTARTKAGEFRLVDKAVPEMAALQTGGWTREIKAFDGEQEVGSLLYANDGTPPTVEVVDTHRERGIATAMYKLARQQGGDLGDAKTGVTAGGQKSARSVMGQAFREKADEDSVTLFQPGADGGIDTAIRRGYIAFGGNRQFTIALLEKADATTFLHETGHFFLEVLGDLATDPNAPAELVADYNAALAWLGVLDDVDTSKNEPPKRPGFIRVYHSGSKGENQDEADRRWVSTSRDYASGYRADSPLFYLDIPAGDPRVNNEDYPDQGVAQGFTFNFELDVAESARLQEINRDAVMPDLSAARARIGVDQHEQWARGFEAYLGEGKAPTAELAPLFARFKAWVKAIYRTLRNLNVDLTDDVRGVFDRLLATDVEITQAEQSLDYAELFKDARSAGWSDAEFATRLQLQQQARDEAENRLMARAMRDVKRETRAWWREREAEMREQVTADVHARPVYQALAYLANGARPDGTPIEGTTKLDKAWLERQYGQAWLNKHLLRRRVYTVSGGADPDVVALGFGYSSGDALVQDLANAAPMADVIAAETRQRMIDEYGDVLSDGTMPEQAMRAVHSDRRYKAMEADLRALERLAGEPRPSAPQLRRIAEAIIGQRRIRDVQPNTYLRAERKAAREAIQAAGRGEWGTALEAQRRRLLNAHLYDVASTAKDETEKLRRYVLRFQKPKLRALLGKIDRLDEVDAILDRYDLRRLSGRKIDQDKAKAELLARIEAGEVIAPAGLVRQLRGQVGRTNWQDLTVEDLRGLRDVLKQIEVAAKAEHEALVNGERVVLDEKAEAMAEATRATGKAVMPVYGELAPDETVKRWGKQALGAWLRPSALARLLDGGDDGAWTRNIIQPIRRAVVELLEPMKRKAHEDLATLYRDHYSVKEMAQMNERAVVPGLGVPLSRWDVIALALNWGNLENRQAVLDSEVAGRKLYTEQGVREALGTLDARDWRFVQAAWDYVDSYWPQIKETQRRRKGIAPPKVEADPFVMTTRDGQQLELKGGYYPLKYNARLDARARQHDMDEAFERMRAGTLSSVQSKYGHVQERVGSGKQPVLLSMNVLHSHINNVVMDLALGDAVNYVDRVLQRPQVRAALIETGNLDALETWKLWLKDTATGEIGARSGVEQLAQLVRFGFTKSKIGFNAMTVALQVTGLAQTIPVVGAAHTAAAVADMAGRPRQAIAQVMAESAFMRARYELNTFNKDISAVQDALRSGAPIGQGRGFLSNFIAAVKAVQLPPSLVSWAFFGIRQVQIVVDSATWLAGYRKATGQGLAHAEAVQYADGIVENAQTSGMFSDRSAIERGTFSETTRQSEFVKLWTTLGSYMIAKGNIAFESYKRTNFKSLPSVLSFGADLGLLFVVEALLVGLIKGGLPDDDDESWWAWTAKTVAEQAAGTIPVVRELPSFIKGHGTGGGPLGSTLSDIARAYEQTQQGELDAALLKSYSNLIGTATGLPSAQLNRLIDAYWREQVEGEDVPAYQYVTGQRKN